MSLLELPEGIALLQDAELTSQAVVGCRDHLVPFLQRYLPWFYRSEQREAATVIIQGKLQNLKRKTIEPIARQAHRKRKALQDFVGCGKWDDGAVQEQLWKHVAEELGDERAVLIVDPSGFPKKGTESCGVARQWCGCLGKVDNCQVGVLVSYAAARGHTLVASRLYLPQEWAADERRRAKCHVPEAVIFQEKWRIGLDLLDQVRSYLPHGWVTGDDELGRVIALREQLRLWEEPYVLDVPSNTLVREVGGKRRGSFERIAVWAARQPAARWRTLTMRAGEQEPLRVRAIQRRMQTKDEDGGVGTVETVLAIQSLGKEQRTWYAVSAAERREPLAELVRVKLERHRVEEDLKTGKQEVGLGH